MMQKGFAQNCKLIYFFFFFAFCLSPSVPVSFFFVLVPFSAVESAINESLRLSSVSMNIRVVQEDFCLRLNPHCSVCVRKGDIVTLYPQSTHLDPEIYPDPEVSI